MPGERVNMCLGVEREDGGQTNSERSTMGATMYFGLPILS